MITITVVTEVTTPESVDERATSTGMVLFPSPGDGNVRLLWSRADVANARIEVLDLAGRTVLRFTGTLLRNGTSRSLDLSGLTNATYLVRIQAPGEQAVSRLVVQH